VGHEEVQHAKLGGFEIDFWPFPVIRCAAGSSLRPAISTTSIAEQGRAPAYYSLDSRKQLAW